MYIQPFLSPVRVFVSSIMVKSIKIRNHLIVRVFSENANRPCVLENLTTTLLSANKQYNGSKGSTVLVNWHKLPTKYLSAALSFDNETGPLLCGYVNLRSILMTQIAWETYILLCTHKGTKLHTSQINPILTSAYENAGFKYTVSANKWDA